MSKVFHVYIMGSKQNGTLYTGMNSNLSKRITEHKSHAVKGFTEKYNVSMLVWAERYDTFISAMTREKQIKTWQRAWKLRLIEELNPEWKDLADEPYFFG